METAAHPITDAIASARSVLAGVASRPAWSLGRGELADDVRAVHELAAQVAELELRLVAQTDHDDLAGDAGDVSTAVWWARETRQTRPVAKRRTKLAAALDGDRSLTREAMGRGHVTEAQAVVIAAAVAALPADDLEPQVVVQAEKILIDEAARLDPRALKIVGDRVLETLAPDVAEEHERRQVEREEQQADESARFSLYDDGHGRAHLRATLSSLHGAMLRQMVNACWTPELGDGTHAMGLAFGDLIERLPVERVPDHGGVAATITVNLDYDQLCRDVDDASVVRLDGGLRLSPGTARRLACESGIIPLVLGKKSAVLDAGRSARFFTKPQRAAIAHRDKTCTAEGCDYPPGFCHYHHDQPWSAGGGTSVANGRLLCPKHHRMVHDGHHEITPSKHGRLLFRRS